MNDREIPLREIDMNEMTHPQQSGFKTIYFFWLGFCAVMTFLVYQVAAGMDWEAGTRVSIVWGIILFASHFLFKLLNKPVNWMTPDVLYLLAFFCFHFGYLALWLFGVVPFTGDIFIYPPLYPKVMMIVNLGMVGFLVGYTLFAPDTDFIYPKGIPSVGWTVLGLLLMCISLLIHLIYIHIVGLSTFLYHGYHVSSFMQEYVSDPRWWRLQPHFFALGFAFYLISTVMRKGKIAAGKLGLALFAFYLLLLIMEGGRTQIVTVGAILIFVQHYLVKPIKLRWLIVIGLLAVTLFGAIAIVRETSALDFFRAGEALMYAKQRGEVRWYAPLVEMGGSVRTINLTVNLVPEYQPFWHGKSYLQSIVHIFPFLQGLLYEKLGVGPAQWTTYTYYGYGAAGTGYSIAGEGYLNFGMVGALLNMCFMGALLAIIYAKCIKNRTPGSTLVFIVTLGIMIISVRNETNVIFAPIAQSIAMVVFLRYILPVHETIPMEGCLYES